MKNGKDRDVALMMAENSGEDRRAEPSGNNSREQEEFSPVVEELEKIRAAGPLPEKLRHWALCWADRERPPQPSLTTKILGVLSRQNLPAHALRSGLSQPAAVLYGNEDVHLDLRIEETPNGTWRVRGQVVSLDEKDDGGPWTLSLLQNNGLWESQESDEFGEFLFEDVGAGENLSLVAEKGTLRLHIARIRGPEPEPDP